VKKEKYIVPVRVRDGGVNGGKAVNEWKRERWEEEEWEGILGKWVLEEREKAREVLLVCVGGEEEDESIV
jgi:hypothetical protein